MFKYAAIEREYGSGGRAVAEELARLCGIPCYGREILEKAGEKLHIPVSELERYEENATNSLLYTISLLGRTRDADPDMLMREGHLFVAEQLAIRELASQGPAIFLGHCAAEAIKEESGVLKVFIKADLPSRRKRAEQEYGIPAASVENTLRRFDRKRSGYYGMNTASKWLDPRNYDVILDSSRLGIQGCVLALKAIME